MGDVVGGDFPKRLEYGPGGGGPMDTDARLDRLEDRTHELGNKVGELTGTLTTALPNLATRADLLKLENSITSTLTGRMLVGLGLIVALGALGLTALGLALS